MHRPVAVEQAVCGHAVKIQRFDRAGAVELVLDHNTARLRARVYIDHEVPAPHSGERQIGQAYPRTEAKAAHAKVPLDMRAKPYGFEDLKTSKKSGISKGFKTAGQDTPEEQPSKQTMGSKFNKEAGQRQSRAGA